MKRRLAQYFFVNTEYDFDKHYMQYNFNSIFPGKNLNSSVCQYNKREEVDKLGIQEL